MAVIGLVACVRRKKPHPAPARELYDSALFLKTRDYVERRCDKWFILSAKYGLVPPDLCIEPYEETLNNKPRPEREAWALKVWQQLNEKLHQGDEVLLLAGLRYREFLVPLLEQHGCTVSIPMKGQSIGKQLQWLSLQSHHPKREDYLIRLYISLQRLEQGLGGKRVLSLCSGRQSWPGRGLYLFFEPGEIRNQAPDMRVVRVGTHAVSRGSSTTLWDRLHTHRGGVNGSGNHRGSIFRLHVGAALSARNKHLHLPSWGKGQSADPAIRNSEAHLEKEVSRHIGSMSILWLSILDTPGPTSDRAYLERNLIGLLSARKQPVDHPSPQWLGLFSPDDRIRSSGLWNLDFLDYDYSPVFLDVLDEYVAITLGQKAPPEASIAPKDWYRISFSSNQLSLFGD